MKNDNIIAILFVTIVTVVIWVWAAGQTKYESSVTTNLRFKPPEGSISTVLPESAYITLTFSGPRSAVEKAQSACEDGLDLTVAAADGEHELLNLPAKINTLDVIRNTGAEISSTTPASFLLDVQTIDLVEAAVEAVLPSVTVSGDVTVDPATVILHIPKAIQDTLPEAITVAAVVSDATLEQLQPGVVHTRDASIRLPESIDGSDVMIEPSRVSVTFKIQSKTQKTVLPQVRVLIAGPAEDYSAYSITLPRTIIPNVTVEADTDLIAGIDAGNITVYAIVRLASRDLEQRISEKPVTTFLAITEDGTGHELVATVEEPTLLNIELMIDPMEVTKTP
ncbi:MAG: hypothetical protein VX436_02780 [Planctomycetota bacterium]|nr:hypothetical protein [Planctomycetota bacterium]